MSLAKTVRQVTVFDSVLEDCARYADWKQKQAKVIYGARWPAP